MNDTWQKTGLVCDSLLYKHAVGLESDLRFAVMEMFVLLK